MTPVVPFPSLAERLERARDGGRKLLVAYLTAGYPDREATERALVALAEAGTDAIELGVPFSDPLADGPVIAAASQAALERGTTLAEAIEIGAEFADSDRPPLVLFTYLNPLHSRGFDRAAGECAAAGFGGVLVADLPFDEGEGIADALAAAGVPLVRLAAPTTPPDRLRSLARRSAGFVYLIARTGVTGAGSGADARLAEQVAVLREETDLPIVIGFGIASTEDARRVAGMADGIVVGSGFVERLGRDGPVAAAGWMRELRETLDRG